MKVAILGSTGMLGSMVKRFLSQQSNYELICPKRRSLNAEAPFLAPCLNDILRGHDYAINCIGVIKPRIDEDDHASVERAVRVNSLFPQRLASAAKLTGCQVIQIATDCVYSGQGGGYVESSLHDATDIYGKTKSLGEVGSPNVHHLRCSIIGPEDAGRPKDSLLEWFLGQPLGATVKGFTNHHWNGITTLAFARICHGIMKNRIALPPVQHVVPRGLVTKAGLLRIFAYDFRKDINVDEVEAPAAVNRTLASISPEINSALWQAAGYHCPVTHNAMLYDLREYK